MEKPVTHSLVAASVSSLRFPAGGVVTIADEMRAVLHISKPRAQPVIASMSTLARKGPVAPQAASEGGTIDPCLHLTCTGPERAGTTSEKLRLR